MAGYSNRKLRIVQKIVVREGEVTEDVKVQLPEGGHIEGFVYDDEGRLLVAVNFNMDIGDAWEHADMPEYPEPMTALAYRFGINYIIYAMTH